MNRLFIVFLFVFVSGCESLNQKNAMHREGVKSKLEQILEKARADQVDYKNSTSNLIRQDSIDFEETATPKDSLWLGQGLHVTYGKIPPKTLVETVVGERPVRFNFKKPVDDDIQVTQLKSANTIKDHLDSISVQMDWAYEIVNGVVVVSDWQDAVISIASLVGVSSAVLKSNSTGDLTDTDNTLTVKTDPYKDVEHLAGEILGLEVDVGDGIGGEAESETETVDAGDEGINISLIDDELDAEAAFSVSRSANLLYVSARPNKVRELREVLSKFNDSVSKRVVIEMTVYDVELLDNNQRSLDLSLLQEASVDIGLNTAGAGLVGDAFTGDFNVNGPFAPITPTDALSLGVSFASGDFLGRLVVAWLETQGTVVNTVTRQFDALNNHAVTFANTTEIEYVKERSIEREEGQSGTQVVSPSVDIGLRTVGRTFNLLPTIVNNRVNIQLSISDKAVISRTPYGDDVLSGTLFEISNTDRMIPLSLGNGETRVLTHFSANRDEDTLVENKLLPFLGDKKQGVGNKTETIIVIKATVVKG